MKIVFNSGRGTFINIFNGATKMARKEPDPDTIVRKKWIQKIA
jgi:hypothetical protein